MEYDRVDMKIEHTPFSLRNEADIDVPGTVVGDPSDGQLFHGSCKIGYTTPYATT